MVHFLNLAPTPVSITDLWSQMAHGPVQLLDICTAQDHAEFPRLIPSARQITAADLKTIEGPATIICQKGLKLSQGAAAILKARGTTASYLMGGIQAWDAAGLPTVLSKDINTKHWVTADGPQAHLIRWLVRFLTAKHDSVMVVDAPVIEPVADKFQARIALTALDVITALGIDPAHFKALLTNQYDHLLQHATPAQGAAFWSMVWASEGAKA